jgi:hypothetical protein
MDEKIDQAILVLLDRIRAVTKADEDLKFSQAALNLAHVRAQYEALQRKKKGAGS